MGYRLRDVIVENFKSYDGRVRIGPFPKFTCIVGPNGAGKSNLMEAISFVLGLQARHLRGERLQDLVHKKASGAVEDVAGKSTSVEVIFSLQEAQEGAVQDDTVSFQRVILSSGESRFLWNSAAVSAQEYQQKLEEIKILSKAKNFLILQGDIQSLAARDSKELTAFLEQVSGSINHKSEYERLSSEKARKEEALRGVLGKKRQITGERKRLLLQNEEAVQYRSLVEERSKLLLEFYLYRLHCNERQNVELQEASAGIGGDMESVSSQLREAQRQLLEADQERARLHLQASQAQKALTTARLRLDRLSPENVAAHESALITEQQLQHLRSRIGKDEDINTKLDDEARKLQRSLESLELQLQEATKNAQEEFPLSEAQQQSFEDAQREAARSSAATSQQIQVLEQRLRGLATERQNFTRQVSESTFKRDRAQRRAEELRASLAAAEEVLAAGKQTSKTRSSQASDQRSKLQEVEQRKATLLAEREGILKTIQDITATERQLQYERHVKQVSNDLAGMVPGVHGRVLDLCEPARRDLHVAIGVALGGAVDAVIVDNSQSGRQCVGFLKERRLDAMTFLPLRDLRAPQPDARLHGALRNRRGLRAALSCLNFQERHAAAFSFLLGDVVIADSLDVGRQFAYGEMRPIGVSCRVVTLEGEQISRDGNLSVSSGMAREGSTRFDFHALESTRSRLETLDRELLELHGRETSAAARTRASEDEIQREEERLGDARRKVAQQRDEIAAKQAELTKSQQEVDAADVEVQRIIAEEASLKEQLKGLHDSVAETSKALFATLSAELGVEDVRQYEQNWRRKRDEARAEEVSLTQRLGTTKLDLRMIEQSLKERTRRSIPKEIEALEQKLSQLREQEQKMKEEAGKLREQVGGMETDVRKSLQAEKDVEKSVAERRHEVSQLQSRSAELAKRLSEMKAQTDALKQARQDLLRESLVDDVDVPLSQPSAGALQDAPGAGGSSSSSAPPPAAPPVSGGETPISIDFTSLPEEKRALFRGPAVKMMEEEYRDNLQRMAVELQRAAPNMKAANQLSNAEKEMEEATEAVQSAHREMKEVEVQFEEVRKARREMFLECFRKVAAEISGIYRQLTANSAGPGIDGGSAFLDLEDTEEPFLGGVKFSVMPPLKRYIELGQLSGGERALAAMALLFSVYSFQKPPLLVLDEVDAPLDASNVDALANYLEKAPCQTLVVSLKDRLYKRSDGLMGVSKDTQTESSVVLSVDLARFRRPIARPLTAG
mmetsp:Transcript_41940/g.98382  ORF Transcript_41940/g.98382 Transcript_41940/m.98382 type:complete len:1245 (-) Transcript_41940:89-3823(-)